jgi:hypothetical protein
MSIASHLQLSCPSRSHSWVSSRHTACSWVSRAPQTPHSHTLLSPPWCHRAPGCQGSQGCHWCQGYPPCQGCQPDPGGSCCTGEWEREGERHCSNNHTNHNPITFIFVCLNDVETTLIQPVCVQGDLTPNHKSAKEDVKCLGLLWPKYMSDRVNSSGIQSVNLCSCVCGQSVTWNRQTSMIQCPVLFCLNRCSLTHSDSNTYRQAGWPEYPYHTQREKPCFSNMTIYRKTLICRYTWWISNWVNVNGGKSGSIFLCSCLMY